MADAAAVSAAAAAAVTGGADAKAPVRPPAPRARVVALARAQRRQREARPVAQQAARRLEGVYAPGVAAFLAADRPREGVVKQLG